MPTTPKSLPLLPHGEMQQLFENLWFVKGQVKMPMLLPVKFSRSMTIVRNPSNRELTLINSMRLSDSALAELEKLGRITQVIRIGGFHGRDDGFYRERYGAKIFAIAGQTYARKMKVPTDVDVGYMQPDAWLTEESELPLEDGELKIFKTCHPPEAALLLKREGGILITGDSLQNTAQADEFVNFVARKMMGKMGFFKAYNVGPGWLQFAKPAKAEVRSLLDLDFAHVLPGHGDPVINDAKEKYRAALEGELKGCHEE